MIPLGNTLLDKDDLINAISHLYDKLCMITAPVKNRFGNW